MLTLSGKAIGRKRPLFADWSFPLPPDLAGDGTTLRDVIAQMVRLEVAAFRDRQEQRRVFRTLTARAIEAAADRGKIDMGGSEIPAQPVDEDAAVATALQAFEDGLYLVVIDDHRGEVDPEASASTVEMRANLLDETCWLLRFKNVRIKNQHALVDGELGKYSVHLGSAVVHKMPGGSLCIVPVHARLFLPFADDDPKIAEVISKVLLLARDGEIQDPFILDQLRHIGV